MKFIKQSHHQVDRDDQQRKGENHQELDEAVQLQRGEKFPRGIEPRTVNLSAKIAVVSIQTNYSFQVTF